MRQDVNISKYLYLIENVKHFPTKSVGRLSRTPNVDVFRQSKLEQLPPLLRKQTNKQMTQINCVKTRILVSAITVENIVDQWLERVKYDLGVARAMLRMRKYLYVAFMCQQTVEKGIKTVLASKNMEIPLTHNLRKLAAIAGIENELDPNWIDFLEQLTPFAIKARYGSYKKRLSEICDRKTAKKLVGSTEEFIKWLRKKI